LDGDTVTFNSIVATGSGLKPVAWSL